MSKNARAGPSKPHPHARPPSPSPSSAASDASDSGTSSSDDVTEDEDGLELTPALDAAILRTLSKLKKGESVILAEELEEAEKRAQTLGLKAGELTKAAKPFLLADHHRQTLLSGSANLDDDEDETEEDGRRPLTHVENERLLRTQALRAFHSLADEEDDEEEDEDDGGFALKKREKGTEDEKQEDEEYRRFLLEMGGGEEEVRRVLGLGSAGVPRVLEDEDEDEEEGEGEGRSNGEGKEVLSKVEREEREAVRRKKAEKKKKNDDDFLMNYILNRGWIDRSEQHVPTYDEIVGPSKNSDDEGDPHAKVARAESSHPWGKLEEEDDFDEKAEEFEQAYNFRFEEPGATAIPTHPRSIPSLVRRPDDTRAAKRAARAERKAAEKAKADEAMRREKGEKRREMERLMEGLKRDLAGKDVDWQEVERVMEDDWEGDEWERVIGGLLEMGAEVEDEEKPTWDDDIDAYEDEDEDGDDGGEEQGDVYGEFIQDVLEGMEDGPINMDADFIDEPAPKKSKKSKKDKGKHRQEEADEVTGLSVDEKARRVKEAMKEYKALDHEDMIGDLPTRFKYTVTRPESFGLTPAEILLATDAELNAIAGVKNIAPYRRKGVGLSTKQGLGKRVRDLKEELKARKWGEETPVLPPPPAAPAGKGKGANSVGLGKRVRTESADGNGGGEKGGEGEGEKRSKKRLGKKQRDRMRKAAEYALQEGQVEEREVKEGGEGREGKRRKKRKAGVSGEGPGYAQGA